VEQYEPDVIGLAETHHIESPREIEGYQFFGQKATTTSQSGTGFYVKDLKAN